MREPLAKGFQRGYQWPAEAEKENFAFGQATVSCDSTKDIVNPQKARENPPEAVEMYKKSHGNYRPGEQKQRDYQWKIDKDSFRFGYGEARIVNGAAMSIHGERDEPGAFPKTVIVKKTVEDVKATQSDILGRPRNLG